MKARITNEIGLLVVWLVIGAFQVINCFTGLHCSWVSYFILFIWYVWDKIITIETYKAIGKGDFD